MRGFFAFGVGKKFSAELAQCTSQIPPDPALSLMLPVDYHVTIKFLSEFSSTRFVEILPELCALGFPSGALLRAGRIALWPSVLALECEPSEGLVKWHARVNGLLERRGFLKERHPRFHPHITLARRKREKKILVENAELFLGRTVPLEAPALWRSQPDGTGRRHMPFLSPLLRA